MASTLAVRFRVDFGNRSSVGLGKIELLEGIARTGARALTDRVAVGDFRLIEVALTPRLREGDLIRRPNSWRHARARGCRLDSNRR